MTAIRSFVAAAAIAGIFCAEPGTARADMDPAVSGEADPLTPKVVEQAPILAPGAPDAKPDATASTSAAATSAAPAEAARHPVVDLVLQRLAATSPASHVAKADREALAAYYTEHGTTPLWSTSDGPTAKAKAAIDELGHAALFGLPSKTAYAVAVPASFQSPEAQADFDVSLDLALMTYARHARGGRADPGHISQLVDMRPHPYDAKSVISSLANTDDPAAALRRFQPQHRGFQNLHKALEKALDSKADAATIQRIEVNMERWRWLPDDLGAFHVRNNLPEQLTRVYDNGQVTLTEKIVIGKPSSPTPIMSADMLFVIFHPSWGVPSGIKAAEVAPLLQRASMRNNEFFGGSGNVAHALSWHELKVSYNGHEINPDSVDWTKVDVQRYDFTQGPSARNVLGIVKFRFPNKHDVYMHDTPERNLFNNGVRAFSHGCMRVQNPVHLAEVILAHDKGWGAEKVQSYVSGSSSGDITLSKPVPVHLVYFTVTADETGAAKTHPDIYGLDARVASALAGAPVSVPSVGPAVTDIPTMERHQRVASPRDQKSGKRTVSQGWDPFKYW